MKPEQPSLGGSFGSLETCTSHRVFFFWMLPSVLASLPAQWATSGSCSAAAACSSLRCALQPMPRVSLEFLVTSGTVCHCLFNRFWKLTYPIFSLRFNFLKDCVILWSSLPMSFPTPATPGCLTHGEAFWHRVVLVQALLWNGDLPALACTQHCVSLTSWEEQLL